MRSIFVLAAIGCLVAAWALAPRSEAAMGCTGPAQLPSAGLQGIYCHHGAMGYAATEFAALSSAANMPRMRKIAFAQREAELKARAALAKFLNEISITEVSVQVDAMLDSSERSAWMAFVGSSTAQSMRTTLAAGTSVIAVEERGDAVFLTVATSPNLQRLSDSLRGGGATGDASRAPSINAPAAPSFDPFSVVPSNRAPQ